MDFGVSVSISPSPAAVFGSNSLALKRTSMWAGEVWQNHPPISVPWIFWSSSRVINPNMGSFMTVRSTYVAILTPHTKRVSNSLGYPFTDYPANILLGGLMLSYRLPHLAISNIVQDTHLKRFNCSFCSIRFNFLFKIMSTTTPLGWNITSMANVWVTMTDTKMQ